MAKTSDRFFDDEDFGNEHDESFFWLMGNNDKVLKRVISKRFAPWDDCEIDRFVGEPIMPGFPPVFPDAIAVGTLWGDHRGRPLIRQTIETYNGPMIRFECAWSGCGNGFTRKPDVPPGSLVWTEMCRGPNIITVFEIKPRISSFARVLRQLQIYRSRIDSYLETEFRHRPIPARAIILLTFDDSHTQEFESQGVDVWNLDTWQPLDVGDIFPDLKRFSD